MKLLLIRIKCRLIAASIMIKIVCIWAADVWRSRKTPRG